MPRKQIDDYTKFVGIYGAKGLAYIKVNERAKGVEGLQSPIVKFIPEANLEMILDRVGAVDGDIVFFGADKAKIVSEALGALRIKLGHDLELLTCEWAPMWVVDFPMFEENDDGSLSALHHPFTAPKCSPEELQANPATALSRAYVAQSTWASIKDELVAKIKGLEMGDVRDHKNFMGAVIKQSAFDRHKQVIDEARKGSETTILAGGECDDSKGFFVRPTLIQTTSPRSRTMCEELFGPILTVYVYPDEDWKAILETVDTTSQYALTGAVFANDRAAVLEAKTALRHAAGNFYINDKPTAAVVGQQPFGGARGSGTNDKAGAPQNLLRWTSARTIKETLSPPTDHRHPYQG